jgi:hypothetical protein
MGMYLEINVTIPQSGQTREAAYFCIIIEL